MRATFLGFEIVRKALNASQKGLDVVTQNISNANTEGYTRQRVDLSAVPSERGSFLYSNSTTADVGMGVNVDRISQARDKVLDYKYRKENAINNTWNTTLAGLRDIANIIDEYDKDGLNSALLSFLEKLHTFSGNTANIEYASLLRTSAQTVAQTLNKYAEQLNELENLQLEELKIVVKDVNQLLDKINKINTEIKSAMVAGYTPNELLDTRNMYLDKLSGYLNIYVENNDDGTVFVKTGDVYLIHGQTVNSIEVNPGYPVVLSDSNGNEFIVSNGQLFAHLQLLNGNGVYASGNESEVQGIQYYKTSLDMFAQRFAEVFNSLNEQNGTPKPLFVGDSFGNITASTISISQDWLSDAMYITASTQENPVAGANDNIIRMIQAMDADHVISPAFTGSFIDFVTSLNGDIAMDVRYYQDMAETSDIVLLSVDEQRESVSGVSLNEESINMIRFQKSYSAAARIMTALDQMLDTLINHMGIAGR
jgi:flagellar hook-associated protein 1 FlgK